MTHYKNVLRDEGLEFDGKLVKGEDAVNALKTMYVVSGLCLADLDDINQDWPAHLNLFLSPEIEMDDEPLGRGTRGPRQG